MRVVKDERGVARFSLRVFRADGPAPRSDRGVGAAGGGCGVPVAGPGGGGRIFRLDGFGVTEYVGLHGVCFCFGGGRLGRESHDLWLGGARAPQPTLTPESRHHVRFHRQPYCLGALPHEHRIRQSKPRSVQKENSYQ